MHPTPASLKFIRMKSRRTMCLPNTWEEISRPQPLKACRQRIAILPHLEANLLPTIPPDSLWPARVHKRAARCRRQLGGSLMVLVMGYVVLSSGHKFKDSPIWQQR